MEVLLGVREWFLLDRDLDSGGLDSYTNVSSESDPPPSISLATLASKMSAFEDPDDSV